VDRDNIVIDGAGYSLRGAYNGSQEQEDLWLIGGGQYQEYNGTVVPWTVGIDMATKTTHNPTVKNLNIKNFSIGIYIWTPNNTITGCAVSDTIVGILLAGDYNTITNNYIAHNVKGIFFGVTPLENVRASVFR
jgi:parallel beta-helix repeat protein